MLEPAGDRRLLALALSNQSQLHMLAYRASDWRGGRASGPSPWPAAGRRLRSCPHALLGVGSVRQGLLGDPLGWLLMEESLRVALAAGEVEHACRS